MLNVLPLLRRLVASVMLAGVLAFTFSGTVIAAHQAANAGHGGYVMWHHHSDAAGDDTVHAHDVDADAGVHVHKGNVLCCGSHGAVALAAPVLIPVMMLVLAGPLATTSAARHPGADPSGLGRPPRTLDIA